MTSLQVLNLASNAFTGEIPASIVSGTSVTELYLQLNLFEGDVPSEFCDSGVITLVADCLDNTYSGNFFSATTLVADNACPSGCCSECCDRDTGQCVSDGFLGVEQPETNACLARCDLFQDGRFEEDANIGIFFL